MSKPVFEDLLVAHGRRNRSSYLLTQLVIFGSMLLLTLMGALAVGITASGPFYIVGVAIGLASGVAFVVAMVAAWLTSAQRCRDIGYSGAWCLTQLIPYVGWIAGLAIMIIPGTPGDNEYGPDPLVRPEQ